MYINEKEYTHALITLTRTAHCTVTRRAIRYYTSLVTFLEIERERQTETERQRERQRDRETERETERDRETEREREGSVPSKYAIFLILASPTPLPSLSMKHVLQTMCAAKL